MTQDIYFYASMLAHHSYALLDSLYTSVETLEGMPVTLLTSRELERKDVSLPGLLPLGPDAPYIQRLAERMKAGETDPSCNPVATLIATDSRLTQEQIERHLTSRPLCFTDTPGKQAYLRFYDPHIFPHFVRILSPERLKCLYGCNGEVLLWTYRFYGQWVPMPAPEPAGAVPSLWLIPQGQCESLFALGKVNGALKARQEQMGRPWKDFAEWAEAANAIETDILKPTASTKPI